MSWLQNAIVKMLIQKGGTIAGTYLITKGIASHQQMQDLGGGIAAAVGIGHYVWDHRVQIIADVKKVFTGSTAIAVIAGAAALSVTGCTLDKPQGKILSITTRGLFCSVSATGSTTGTPEVKLGLGSQTVTMIPTDTNKVYAADFANSSTISQSVNPFNTSGSESLAAGSYQVNQTNTSTATQPVVAK